MRISTEEAISLLAAGDVVALPTETVYGLAASIRHPQAIQKIFELKNRPQSNPLIVHLASAHALERFVGSLPPNVWAALEKAWPGPLTLILPVKDEQIPLIARAGKPTAAFRVPDHPLTQKVLERTGPLVMPSANLSGSPSSTAANHVEEDFGLLFPVLDGGVSHHGVESTILEYDRGSWQILRLGALTQETLETLFQMPVTVAPKLNPSELPRCPGQLFRHYAPRARLHIAPLPSDMRGRWILGCSNRSYPEGALVLSLGSAEHPEEVAHRLYDSLREIDRRGIEEIWVDPSLPTHGLWKTILERLHKASET